MPQASQPGYSQQPLLLCYKSLDSRLVPCRLTGGISPKVSLLLNPSSLRQYSLPANLYPKGTYIQNQNLTAFQDISTRTVPSVVWAGGAATLAAIAVTVYALKRKKAKTNTSPVIVPKFTNENITAQFVAAIPVLTPQLNLEVATATQTETFTRSSS